MFFLAYLPVLPLKILRICLPQRSYICTTSLDNTNEGRGKGDECMQKKAWIAVVCLLALLTLAGCGKKSQEDVITDLEQARAAARRDAEENERMKRELKEQKKSLPFSLVIQKKIK